MIHGYADGFSFPDLRPEIDAILRIFAGPLSAIFVAPAAPDDRLPRERIPGSHQALAQCMQKFSDARRVNRNPGDNLLLLATKWDQMYSPALNQGGNGADNFANPSSQTVIDALVQWGFSWPKFSQMDEVHTDAKALMPYAATWLDNGVRMNEGRYKSVFEKFNRTVWNWLYGNAFSEIDGKGRRGKRKDFFRDVSLRGTTSDNFYDAFLRHVVSVVDW